MEAPDLLVENARDGTLLVLVPSGPFLAGPDLVELAVPAFYLALHPVTNAQYHRFLQETGRPLPPPASPLGPGVWTTGEAPPLEPDHPVVNIDWDEARDYCAWAGLRLPTELEWEKAARGSDGRTYPWGDRWDPARCRHRGNAEGVRTTAAVWDFPGGTGPWGHYQMAGNVWEICADAWVEDPYARAAAGEGPATWLPSSPPGERRYALRGGAWSVRRQALRTTTRYPDLTAPGAGLDAVGFRCARSL